MSVLNTMGGAATVTLGACTSDRQLSSRDRDGITKCLDTLLDCALVLFTHSIAAVFIFVPFENTSSKIIIKPIVIIICV